MILAIILSRRYYCGSISYLDTIYCVVQYHYITNILKYCPAPPGVRPQSAFSRLWVCTWFKNAVAIFLKTDTIKNLWCLNNYIDDYTIMKEMEYSLMQIIAMAKRFLARLVTV